MNRLKEVRETRNISQTQLAASIGVSARHIAFIEAGDRKPSVDVACKIAKLLETPVEKIFLSDECTESTFESEDT